MIEPWEPETGGRDAHLRSIYARMLHHAGQPRRVELEEELRSELKSRRQWDLLFESIAENYFNQTLAELLTRPFNPDGDWDCYRQNYQNIKPIVGLGEAGTKTEIFSKDSSGWPPRVIRPKLYTPEWGNGTRTTCLN